MSDLEEIAIGIVTIVVVFGIFAGLVFLIELGTKAHDDELWDDGKCYCGGHWEYEQAVGHRSSTSYIYVCDRCGKRIEISEVR